MIWSVWRAWPRLPRPIQRHAQLAAAINIPLYLLFVVPGELRDLSMLYIVFLLVLAVNLKEWMGSAEALQVRQPGRQQFEAYRNSARAIRTASFSTSSPLPIQISGSNRA
jgi:hypothetical protein